MFLRLHSALSLLLLQRPPRLFQPVMLFLKLTLLLLELRAEILSFVLRGRCKGLVKEGFGGLHLGALFGFALLSLGVEQMEAVELSLKTLSAHIHECC